MADWKWKELWTVRAFSDYYLNLLCIKFLVLHAPLSLLNEILNDKHTSYQSLDLINSLQMPDGGSLWARVRLQGRKAARWRFQIVLNSGTFKLKGRSNKRPPHRLSLLVTRKKRNCRSQELRRNLFWIYWSLTLSPKAIHSFHHKKPTSWHVTDPTKPNNAALIIPNNLEPIEFETTFNSRTALNNVSISRWLCYSFYKMIP